MASDAEEEVAEDYRHALEDLSTNMRFEITNLTVIARENTEHALAIAEVLQQHILKAPPNKKLPALYVLDSIVKNVGTPYTLYFGRNLFKTFMESYVVVDHNIRRKMEEMLRTWKDPVPGSMDTRPVFSHELVRPIENALQKARAASMPQQGSVTGRSRSAMTLHRSTPTPPGIRATPGPPGAYSGQPSPQLNGGRPSEMMATSFSYPGQQTRRPLPESSSSIAYQQSQFPQYSHQSSPPLGASPSAPFQPAHLGPFGSTGPAASVGISVETLSNDIQALIVAIKTEFSHNPHDVSVQNRLRGLLDLQDVVQRTSLPSEQLELIKNKVTELAAVKMRPSLAQNTAQTSALVPRPLAVAVPPHTSVTPNLAPNPTQAPAPAPTSSSQAPVTLDTLLGAGALAKLMARQTTTPQQVTPSTTYSLVTVPPPSEVTTQRPKPPAQNASSLLDQLRQAGILPSTTPTTANSTTIAPPASSPSAPSILPPNITSLLSASHLQNGPTELDVTASTGFEMASLKQQFRPDAVAALHDELGHPCTQCGRRFRVDDESRKRKMTHMDWHFRVHQRSTEAEKRGLYRSWYVENQDWVRSREFVDSEHVAAPEESVKEVAANDKQPKYIPVPDPTRGISNVCLICQEKFENKWLDIAQEWVWLDTVLVGNRACHASCHAEATMDRESTPVASRPTPEPLLGKRKAETSVSSPKIRVMKTSA